MGPLGDNQRLEFLGDAILGFVVSDYLFRRYAQMDEGELTRLRAALVSTTPLAQWARRLNLGDALALGRGEEEGGGRSKPSILAAVLESVVAAIFLEEGLDSVRTFILDSVEAALGRRRRRPTTSKDAKSLLQERVQQLGGGQLSYRTDKMEGPPHDRVFSVVVSRGGQVIGQGRGRTKKDAEQAAAREGLRTLESGGKESGKPGRN